MRRKKGGIGMYQLVQHMAFEYMQNLDVAEDSWPQSRIDSSSQVRHEVEGITSHVEFRLELGSYPAISYQLF